jgi:CheY-like chemotaxis protein
MGSTRSLVGLRILLAEDQQGVREVLARLLRRRGMDVTAVPDGTEALRRVRTESDPFHLILVDRDMPGLTGDRVLNAVAAMEDLPFRPWLLLMSGDLPDRVDDTLPPGTILVGKPFEIAELVTIIRTTIGEERHEEAG